MPNWRLLPVPPLSQPDRTWASSIAVFSEDGRARIAVGTTLEGLWIRDGSAWRRLGPEEGLPSPNVTDLVPYRGGLAVATAEGLCELRGRRLDCRLRDVDPRLAGSLLALYAASGPDEVPTLWIAGPEWAGWLQGEALELLGESLGLRRFSSSNTGAIAVDAAGGVYVGAPNRGWFWDPVERRLSELGPLQGVSLLVREGDAFIRVDLPAEAAELTTFRWLSFSPNGRPYLATRRGLLAGDGDRWQVVHAPTPEADDIYNLLAEPSGDAWVGTAAGLYRLRGERLVTADLGGRRLDRPVYQIFEDPRGHIWFGTDDGVWRWDSVELRHFTVRHGLVGRETNRGAGFVDHDLKTPLVTVKGFLGLLERDLASHDTERIRTDVDHIRRAGDTMGALLDGPFSPDFAGKRYRRRWDLYYR